MTRILLPALQKKKGPDQMLSEKGKHIHMKTQNRIKRNLNQEEIF